MEYVVQFLRSVTSNEVEESSPFLIVDKAAIIILYGKKIT
jgi:hypothetical protein